ncbi:hypothetical protein M5E87_15550 [Flavonifractor plautii]|nr:hypothetical protein M5E87_15550 [Flavonifractor plautii]
MNVFSLSWAAAGLALLGLSLFPAYSLALGGAPAHLAVFLLLLALAALALRLLRREGLDRPGCWPPCCPSGWPSSSAPCCWTTSPPITRCSSPNGPRPSGMGAASRP